MSTEQKAVTGPKPINHRSEITWAPRSGHWYHPEIDEDHTGDGNGAA